MKTTRSLKFSIMVILACTCASAWGQYSGDKWSAVKSSGSGTISLAYVETPGFVYKDSNGKLTGICVDIMNDFVNYVNTKHGVQLASKYVGDGSSFSGMYSKVRSSKDGVIGLGNITIRDSRKKEVKFSPPFITNFSILVTQAAVPTLADMSKIQETFKGLTAYAPKGTTNEKRLLDIKKRHFGSMQINYVASSQEALQKVMTDKAAFAYLDLAFYLDAMQRRRPVKRHPVGDQSSEQFGFIMPMNSDWQPLMKEFFEANGGYTNTTAYKKILTKHLGDTGVKLLQTAK